MNITRAVLLLFVTSLAVRAEGEPSPEAVQAYDKGTRLMMAGDYEGAIPALSKAIELEPDVSENQAQLGSCLCDSGQYKESLAVLDKAIKLAPEKAAISHFQRCMDFYFLDKPEDAAAAARKCVEGAPAKEPMAPYATLMGYFMFQRAGKKADADALLKLGVDKVPHEAWPFPILQLLQGTAKEEDLMHDFTDPGQVLEMHAYLGFVRLMEKKTDAAKKHFTMVKETGKTDFYEYRFAIHELKALEK